MTEHVVYMMVLAPQTADGACIWLQIKHFLLHGMRPFVALLAAYAKIWSQCCSYLQKGAPRAYCSAVLRRHLEVVRKASVLTSSRVWRLLLG